MKKLSFARNKGSIVDRLAGSLNHLVPKSKLKIPTDKAIEMARDIVAQEIALEGIDESKFAVAGYDKLGQKYTDLYYDDTSDLGFFEKFVTKLPKGARVLDIGCGPGTFTQHFAAKGFSVTGIDLSTTMIEIARKKLPQVNFRLMDMRHLDFSANSFDAIFCAYSLIHIPSEEIVETLTGFRKVLRPEMVVGIITQKGETDKIVAEPMDPGEKMFFNFFTKDRLKQFLSDASFTLEYQEEAVLADAEGSGSDRVIYTIARK